MCVCACVCVCVCVIVVCVCTCVCVCVIVVFVCVHVSVFVCCVRVCLCLCVCCVSVCVYMHMHISVCFCLNGVCFCWGGMSEYVHSVCGVCVSMCVCVCGVHVCVCVCGVCVGGGGGEYKWCVHVCMQVGPCEHALCVYTSTKIAQMLCLKESQKMLQFSPSKNQFAFDGWLGSLYKCTKNKPVNSTHHPCGSSTSN